MWNRSVGAHVGQEDLKNHLLLHSWSMMSLYNKLLNGLQPMN